MSVEYTNFGIKNSLSNMAGGNDFPGPLIDDKNWEKKRQIQMNGLI